MFEKLLRSGLPLLIATAT